jgi:hypothetical protein
MFATENGAIAGWNGGAGTTAITAVLPSSGAVYKGLALGVGAAGPYAVRREFFAAAAKLTRSTRRSI